MSRVICASIACADVGERLVDDRRNLRLQQLVQRRLVLRLQRLERQLVLREEAERGGIEDRRGRARIEERHRHAEVVVHAAELAEVGELVRSGDVADRREERVLDDRAQQHVRAEAGGTFRRLRRPAPPWDTAVADQEAAVLLPDRAPAAILLIRVKQREAVVLRVHLRVIAARREIGAGERRELTVCPGIDSSRAKTWLTSGFDAGSDESYTISPRSPRTSSIHRPNASAIPTPGV